MLTFTCFAYERAFADWYCRYRGFVETDENNRFHSLSL